MVDTFILSILNAAIAGLRHRSRKIWKLWDCRDEPNADGGPYTHNVTPMFDNNTAARWLKAAMKLGNKTVFRVGYRSQQPDGTAGAQGPMHGGRCYLPLGDIFPPPAEDMIDDIGEESEDDGDTRFPKKSSFATTTMDFEWLEGSCRGGLSDSSDTLKSSETVLLVWLLITSKALLLKRMQLG